MLSTSVGLLPIRLFPSTSTLLSRATSTLLSRATSTSSPVIGIRNSRHFPIPSSRSMSSGAAEEERGKEEEEKSVPDDNKNGGDVIVQYVVLRRDLVDTWPTGSVVAQGCHASVAAIWAHRDHSDTASYLSDTSIDSMHKVALEVKGEIQIRNLSEKLKAGGIEHKLWMEQPENFPTCLATRPYPKSQVASYFKKLKLCK